MSAHSLLTNITAHLKDDDLRSLTRAAVERLTPAKRQKALDEALGKALVAAMASRDAFDDVRLLLDLGANPDTPAAGTQCDRVVKGLSGDPVVRRSPIFPDETRALHLAVQYRDGDLVERLLALGADPNTPTKYGHTPLIFLNASVPDIVSDDPLYDHDLIIATRLLDAGASPNALNKDAPRAHEKSPLYMLAVAETSSVRDRMAMARLLLERGGDPNIGTNEYTWTTLQGLADHARSASHLSEQTVADLASLMVEAGVDATRRDRHGLTAMQIAERKRAPNEFLLNVIEAAEQQTPSP